MWAAGHRVLDSGTGQGWEKARGEKQHKLALSKELGVPRQAPGELGDPGLGILRSLPASIPSGQHSQGAGCR